MLYVVVGIVAVAAVVAGAYNRLVGLRNRTEVGWAHVDVQLQRRHDLIPNLVAAVKGHASHERATFEAVVAARSAAVDAGTAQGQAAAETALTGALRQLFAVAESYPQLTADSSFLALQRQLAATEDRVAYARTFYNDAVKEFRVACERFPMVLVARTFTFEPGGYFEPDVAAAAVPQVTL